MLISSHDLSHITDVSQRIVILEKGKVVKDLLTSNNTLEELESYFNPDATQLMEVLWGFGWFNYANPGGVGFTLSNGYPDGLEKPWQAFGKNYESNFLCFCLFKYNDYFY